MSYRSVKRVLGETNLERKCRFLFGIALLALITGSFYFYGRQTEKLVYESNRNTGRLLVDTIITRIHWEKTTETPDRQLLAKLLGEYIQNTRYQASFIKPSPDDSELAGQPQDEFEWEVLDDFKNGRAQVRQRRVDDEQEYHYYQAVRASHEGCFICHKPQPGQEGKVGDLMAIAKVVIPEGPTQQRLNTNRAILIATAVVTVSLAMLAAYLIVRYVIAKPLKHLKEVTDEVSHGNTGMRADISTGDEFEELGRAFNRMLQHLLAVQQELRQVNSDLDAKVDELAQANLTLYEMNRLKSDFLATMSHELRTPLNSILGFSEVLATIDSLDEKQRRYVKNIQQSGKLLLDMINDILDLAKIESGKMELRITDFKIEHVIAAQCDLARPLTEKKNIDLVEEVEEDMPLLHQDQGKLQQILANLLSNAIKFTPEGGRISVRARATETNEMILVVSDTGVGIADEDQEVVFEKFRQGNSVLPTGDAMTREYSGTGLGLSIVKELCKLLGGSVVLESELGKGSTFTVRLPIALPDSYPKELVTPDPLAKFTSPHHFDRARSASVANTPE